MATVLSFYEMVQAVNEGSSPHAPLVNKYQATIPNDLLYPYVRGIVADDLSYVGNPTVIGAETPDKISFKIDNLPLDFTSVTVNVRLQANGTDLSNGTVSVDMYQGLPRSGSTRIGEIDFPADISGAYTAATWYEFTQVINVALITDRKDLWMHIRMDRGTGLSDALFRMSWLVLQVGRPTYQLAETPVSKNYANSLRKIVIASAIQKGTTGTTKWRYRIVPCDADGCAVGSASDEFGVGDGNDTLDATDHICISWLDIVGATSYKVYRMFAGGTPSSTGLIGTVLPGLGDCGTGEDEGDTGIKDTGDEGGEEFDESLCQGVTTVTYPSAEDTV
ncbi:hypothetical protein LCGC14_0908880 [marine sediment metagenome]|uniref:Uncharacterized protein n=1 Tax=marine sediment metagenome TaxID=412755 RepID=A0A0F9NU75_9ZZZZ